MFKPRDFQECCNAMQTRAVIDIDGTIGVINGIKAEDGSGRCWVVTIQPLDGKAATNIFLRDR